MTPDGELIAILRDQQEAIDYAVELADGDGDAVWYDGPLGGEAVGESLPGPLAETPPVAANPERPERIAVRLPVLPTLDPELQRAQEQAPAKALQMFRRGISAAAALLGRTAPLVVSWPEVERLVSSDAGLREAHARIIDFFPRRRWKQGRFQVVRSYETPSKMSDSILGQNFKTEKKTPQRIKERLFQRTGFREADVQGLSLLPQAMSWKHPDVQRIAKKMDRTYRVPRVLRGWEGFTLCLKATDECAATCLVFSGRNLMEDYNSVKKYCLVSALLADPVAFLAMLTKTIERHARLRRSQGTMPLVRLNVFSDIPWELFAPGLFERFGPDAPKDRQVQFYDYTKVPNRNPQARVPNYDLTFSYAGTSANVNDMDFEIRENGRRVALVFAATKIRVIPHAGIQYETPKTPEYYKRIRGKRRRYDAPLPETFLRLPVIDGDESDMRPYDPAPAIVGLRWKEPANQGATLLTKMQVQELEPELVERIGKRRAREFIGGTTPVAFFVVRVDLVSRDDGRTDAVVSKTARFDNVNYAAYAPSETEE